MRFLALSVFINLVILFLPINLYFINVTKPELKAQKQINLKLNIKKEEPKKEPKITPDKPKEQIKPKIEPKPKPEPKIKPKPTPKPKKIKKVKKPKITTEKPKIAQKTKQISNQQPNLAKFQAPEQTKQTKQTQIPKVSQSTENLQKVDFCAENIGFVILEQPSQKYPKKAKRLRLNKIIKVEVYFKIDKNNQIKVQKVVGENEIFNQEARKRTENMKLKTLNQQATNCVIIKPYKFIP